MLVRLLVQAGEREAGDHEADQAEEDELNAQGKAHQAACPPGAVPAFVAVGGVRHQGGVAEVAIGLDHLIQYAERHQGKRISRSLYNCMPAS